MRHEPYVLRNWLVQTILIIHQPERPVLGRGFDGVAKNTSVSAGANHALVLFQPIREFIP